MATDEVRAGVELTNLDGPLFDGAGHTKRDLVDYLEAVADLIVPQLAERPLSVIRVRPGQAPFMQKNLPRYAPSWLPSVEIWAESSHRTVTYALCNDRRALLWFANQRAVEYHPTLFRVPDWDRPTHLVLDIDPPDAEAFPRAVAAAHVVRRALGEVGLEGAVKTSGAKGLHVFVPLAAGMTEQGGAAMTEQVAAGVTEQVAAATRALAARAERLDPDLLTTAFVRQDRHGKVFLDATRAGGATVIAAYSPRLRPGVPVSFPLRWDDLDAVTPGDFRLDTALSIVEQRPSWSDLMPAPQALPEVLIEEGHAIPVARVQAMHEGKRRARARRGL